VALLEARQTFILKDDNIYLKAARFAQRVLFCTGLESLLLPYSVPAFRDGMFKWAESRLRKDMEIHSHS
jgi:hypothetical protein